MSGEGPRDPCRLQRLSSLSVVAGFQSSISGRFWVSTESNGTLADLITSLEDAQAAGRLSHRLNTLIFPSLLVVDEIGYLPITRTGAMLLFQLMSRRFAC